MSVINAGDYGYDRDGPERWIPDGWGLDRLVVPMIGAEVNRAAFIASLAAWDPSDIDSHMYLTSWPNDGNKQFPTVDLNYIGKKGGVMPPVRHSSGTSVQSASSVRSISLAITIKVDALYYAPQSTVQWISDTESVGASAADPQGEPKILKLTFDWLAGPRVIPPGFVDTVLEEFFDRQISVVDQAEELVPGKYWQNRQTKVLTLVQKLV